jgi:uncharacterized protein YfaS (alpha-2-macroglobulin family)
MANYDYGDLVNLTANFQTGGVDVDPTAVYCQVMNPAGSVVTYAYGTDEELVKDNAGDYHLEVNANQAGRWRYRWYSTGTGQAADEGSFYVANSRFA